MSSENKFGEPWQADGDVWESIVWLNIKHGAKRYHLFEYKSNTIEASYLRRIALDHNACAGLTDEQVTEMRKQYDEQRKA